MTRQGKFIIPLTVFVTNVMLGTESKSHSVTRNINEPLHMAKIAKIIFKQRKNNTVQKRKY